MGPDRSEGSFRTLTTSMSLSERTVRVLDETAAMSSPSGLGLHGAEAWWRDLSIC